MPDAASRNTPEEPRRSSIDLSLELEHQLESESLPNSPLPAGAHGKNNGSIDGVNVAALDPNVLAHIVAQLRDSLTNMTNERDDLITTLSESHSRIAEFKDAIALLTDRIVRLESDLEYARKKHQDDEEAISMLRSKGVLFVYLAVSTSL